MLVVSLDIESTAPDYHGEEKFPPTAYHVPEVIAWIVAKNGTEFRLNQWDRTEEPEANALARIAADLCEADRLVSFNGRVFDCPLMSIRALAAGVDWKWWPARRHRYDTFKQSRFHLDLMDELSDLGAARGISLNRVAQLCGLPGKVGIDGSEVAAALARGERKRVRDYCCNDSFETLAIYYRWCKTHQGIKEAHQAFQNALAWAATEPTLSQFYAEAAA